MAGARRQFSQIVLLVTTLCEKMRAFLLVLVVADYKTQRAAKSRVEVDGAE